MPLKDGYFYPGNDYLDPNLGSPVRVTFSGAVSTGGGGGSGSSGVVSFASPQPVYNTQAITATFVSAQPVTIAQALTAAFASAQPVYLTGVLTTSFATSQPVYNTQAITATFVSAQPVTIAQAVTAAFASSQPVYNTQAITATFPSAQPVIIAQPITASFVGSPQPVYLSQTASVNLNLIATASWNNTSSFSSLSYITVFGPIDVSFVTNFALSIVNNSSVALTSGSVEFSPNNSNFEQWDIGTFTNLSASSTKSMQVWANSRKWLRVRAISATGSLDIYVHANNG